ncbi:MAG: YceI family protein [Bacteroidota bacterium]
MKKVKMILIAVLAIMGQGAFAQINWIVDQAHTKVGFSVTHMAVSQVEGNFKKFEGKITTEDEDFKNTNIQFTLDVNSITTENEMRDKHIKSDDFFNAEKFPTITFKSKSFKKIDGKKYILTGDMTVRDVTKTVDLAVIYNGKVNDPYGNLRAGFKVSGKINRLDYNLKWNTLMGGGDAVVGKDVEFNVNIEVTKEKVK